MIIDGVECTLLRDYDQEHKIYHHLSFDGKVKYLHGRIEMILLKPARTAMKEALRTDLGFILTTAICAGISAAGPFLKGRRAPPRKDQQYFLDFVKAYMDPVLQDSIKPGLTWAEWLYGKVRCGLAHGYAIEYGGVEFEVPNYVLVKTCGPEMNPEHLLEDFAKGLSKYLQDVAKSGPTGDLGSKFEKRFIEIFHD